MHFSKISCLSMLALANSAIAVPAPIPIEHIEGSTEVTQDAHKYEKRFGPIAIALIQVIGGTLISGAAKAAIDIAKAHLTPEQEDFKDFDAARTAFMQEYIVDFWDDSKTDSKGVACINGGYHWTTNNPSFRGPATVKFSWDIYHTTYDCFEINAGTLHNDGDGGWINVGYAGNCVHNGKDFIC